MRHSKYIKTPDRWSDNWHVNLKAILELNGIPKERVLICDPFPQEHMSFLLNQTDVGVFPNRCEGGTNLVMMEYAACHRPVIANVWTGHRDVRDCVSQFICGEEGPDNWFLSEPEDVAEALELFHKERPPAKGFHRPWSEPAKEIVAAIEAL